MRCVWSVAAFAMLIFAGTGREAAADVADVDCNRLERIRIAQPESYDEVYCVAGGLSGLAIGESGSPVGGPLEVIVAYSRATFAIVRFDGTNNRSFMRLPSVREHIDGAMASLALRGWGEERRHDRFSIADVEAKVSDDSPYLSCIGFLAKLRPVAGAPGYREAVGGLYCAMDTLTPTEGEVAAFLDGLTF